MLNLHASQDVHQARAYPGICSMKLLEIHVFLFPPGWDASPLQGYLLLTNILWFSYFLSSFLSFFVIIFLMPLCGYFTDIIAHLRFTTQRALLCFVLASIL